MAEVRAVAPPVGSARSGRRSELLRSGLGPLLQERPWAEVRMADVASAAGVSRQTLYDEFGSRQGLAEAYVASETERFLSMVDVALRAGGDDVGEVVAGAIGAFLTAAGTTGVLRAIVTDDGNHELLALVTTHGQSVLDASTARLSRFFLERWPGTAPEAARLGARSLVRLALSYATQPDGPPEQGAGEIAALVTPYLREVLAGP